MKLNTKQTILVGLAFLSIQAFWQLYDNVIPLILKNTFQMRDGIAGIIMSLDNVLALFLLPFFGTLSDKSRFKMGKRMPFILCGTGLAVVLMNLLPLAERRGNLPMFVIVLGILLVAMGIYRSPAVALMPDVTPKPLRSKGNAVINLMGALGGVFTLGITGFVVTKDAVTGRENYQLLFFAVAFFMVAAVTIMFLSVRERTLAEEAVGSDPKADEVEVSAEAAADAPRGFASLAPELRTSLILILLSVFFWFMGYNAVTTAFTKYVSVQWGYDIKAASLCLMIATLGAVVSYVPVGALATKYGRKRMIQIGIVSLAGCFAISALFQRFHPSVYVVFGMIGASWAMINVNSYPMVVEISKSSDVGKFTGYYYTFSMGAQIATPILSGLLLEHVGYWTLLPYGAVMVAVSFVTISMTRHGDSKPARAGSGLESFHYEG